VRSVAKGTEFKVRHGLTDRQRKMVLAGGLLNYVKQQAANA
jgi:hypothetical protein